MRYALVNYKQVIFTNHYSLLQTSCRRNVRSLAFALGSGRPPSPTAPKMDAPVITRDVRKSAYQTQLSHSFSRKHFQRTTTARRAPRRVLRTQNFEKRRRNSRTDTHRLTGVATLGMSGEGGDFLEECDASAMRKRTVDQKKLFACYYRHRYADLGPFLRWRRPARG